MRTQEQGGSEEGQSESLRTIEQQAAEAIEAFSVAQQRFSCGGDLYGQGSYDTPEKTAKLVEVLTEPANAVIEAVAKFMLNGSEISVLDESLFDGPWSVAAALDGYKQKSTATFWKFVACRMAILSRKS